MAVYYVNPFLASGTGTGTFADPFSMTNSSRTVAAGDEVRLIAKYISDILTATTYTATYQTTQITLSAGAADWFAGDIAYFPDFGSFAKVRSKSGSTLLFGVGGMVPVPMIVVATLNVRRVDPALAPPLSGSNAYFIGGNSAVNNVTVSDGWVADGTRVTDSSVISLIHTAASGLTYYLNYLGGTIGEAMGSNWTFDCGRTALLGGVGVNAALTLYFPALTSTLTFFQIFSTSSSATCMFGGLATYPPLTSATVNITHYNCAAVLGSGVIIKDLVMNLTNYYTQLAGYWTQVATGGNSNALFDTATVTIGNYIASTGANSISLLFAHDYIMGRMFTTFTTALKMASSPSPFAQNISRSFGNYDVSFGAGFAVYDSSGTPVTTLPRKWGINSNPTWVAASLNTLVVPKINTPPGVSFTGTHYDFRQAANLRPFGNSSPLPLLVGGAPTQRFISMPDATSYALPQWNPRTGNLLTTFRDGTADPIEILGLSANMRGDSMLSLGLNPQVTLDPTVFVTSGSPSLKSLLSTYSANPLSYGYFTKAIKLPVTSGVSKTVTGWVKSDRAIADGDIVLRVVLDNTTLATQSMTSAAGTTFQQFTLTFTPSYTGEADFLWDQKFSAGGQAFWLADLTTT